MRKLALGCLIFGGGWLGLGCGPKEAENVENPAAIQTVEQLPEDMPPQARRQAEAAIMQAQAQRQLEEQQNQARMKAEQQGR
ncbi:MAG: hypothetical protein SNJ74_00465 [Fimbriimonadaceae bacterium]